MSVSLSSIVGWSYKIMATGMTGVVWRWYLIEAANYLPIYLTTQHHGV